MKQCYLCGTTLIKNVNKSRDHIPPDCFFPPGTQDMITVPCCIDCNEEYDPLDHKMRNHMAGISPMLSEPTEQGKRAVLRSTKLKKEFLSYTKPHPTLLDNNREHKLVFFFDEKELTKWLSRLTKGLFFNENHQRISNEAIISAKVLPKIQPQPSLTFPVEKGLERRPYFVYQILPDEIELNKNYCIMIFYDQVVFMVAFDTFKIAIS